MKVMASGQLGAADVVFGDEWGERRRRAASGYRLCRTQDPLQSGKGGPSSVRVLYSHYVLLAPTRDQDLRHLVHRRLLTLHGSDEEAVIADELSVGRGTARVDVALVNGCLAGFELKSEVDRLDRLRTQIPEYTRVFDEMILVVAPRHEERALKVLPACWGVWVADPSAEVQLHEARAHSRNSDVSAHAVAGLLWRDEMIELLERYDLATGVQSKPRRKLIEVLVAGVGSAALTQDVRCYLRARLIRERRAIRAPQSD